MFDYQRVSNTTQYIYIYYIYIYTYKYIYMYICMYIYMYMYVYIYVYLYIYIFWYVYVYIYNLTQWPWILPYMKNHCARLGSHHWPQVEFGLTDMIPSSYHLPIIQESFRFSYIWSYPHHIHIHNIYIYDIFPSYIPYIARYSTIFS